MHVDSAESAGGRLGAVLAAPRSGVAALGPAGPWLTTTPDQARQVLTDPVHFDFPGDISRSGDLSASRGETRSGHTVFAPVSPDQVARGLATFTHEWRASLTAHAKETPDQPYDAMALLRRPVARSTTDALLPAAGAEERHRVADQVLTWIDALGPVIAARRPPGRWSRTRRAEREARLALEDTLGEVPGLGGTPAHVATMLAAGVQVPIAAGAWLLAWLAHGQRPDVDPVFAVWETLRLTPPTWITARITTSAVELAGQLLPAGAVVMVSPLLLGRVPDLVPGHPSALGDFDPDRWRADAPRPGAWLPFGAGAHACPGRTLGLAQLTHVARWATAHDLTLCERVGIDQSRGILPSPCRFIVAGRTESSS